MPNQSGIAMPPVIWAGADLQPARAAGNCGGAYVPVETVPRGQAKAGGTWSVQRCYILNAGEGQLMCGFTLASSVLAAAVQKRRETTWDFPTPSVVRLGTEGLWQDMGR